MNQKSLVYKFVFCSLCLFCKQKSWHPPQHCVVSLQLCLEAWHNPRVYKLGLLLSCSIKEMRRNESSFLHYLPLFWSIRQSRATVDHDLSLSQNTPISWYTYHYKYCYIWICIWRCVNRVTILKFLVYSVKKMHCPLLYIISLWYQACALYWKIFSVTKITFLRYYFLVISSR